MSAVILFKSPEEDLEVDPYATALSERDLHSFFIPVLRHFSSNDDKLKELVVGGSYGRYGGVIATSSRAAEMWVRTVEEVIEDGSGEADWRTTPFYVVGQKTSRVLSGDGRIPPDSVYKPTLLLGAQESGTGAKLAEFIMSDYPSRVPVASTYGSETPSPSSWLPLLYLTGDKTTGTLLETLHRDGRIRVEQLQVYRTQPREDFEEDFTQFRDLFSGTAQLPESPAARNLANVWLVFFAPSAARAVLPAARRHFQIDTEPEQVRRRVRNRASETEVRIAAIGPTTATYLRTDAQLLVHFVPEKPGPTELADGIANASVIV